MQTTQQLAQHLRNVHFGGNWTAVNLRDTLVDVDWSLAKQKIDGINTIGMLAYHIHYYVKGVLPVFNDGSLVIRDKYSFDVSPINSQEEWQKFLDATWQSANALADAIEALPDGRLHETFVDEKYGTFLSNIVGIIEHTHYHLGQIVIIKKVLRGGG